MKLFENPGEQCRDIAASKGLVLVGTPISGGTMTCVIGPASTYSCPAGTTQSGSSCLSNVALPASLGGYSCSSGTLSGSSCLSTGTSAASVGYSCPGGQTLSGASCIGSGTSSTAGTPIYGCPSGYTLVGSSCISQGTATTPATAAFTCAGGTLSGVNCSAALRRTRYEAYGNTSAGAVRIGIGFTGHVNDPDTGLVYMQQRYYDPIAARFMSVDQVATDANTGDTFNRYEYAHSNPYRYTDPDGRQAQLAAVPLVMAIVRAVAAQAAPAAVGVAAGAAIGNAINSTANSANSAPAPASAAGSASGSGERPSKTPNTGPPGSTYVNPGSGQERTYGPDGRPVRDVDHDHPHDGVQPHQHEWINGVRQPGVPIPAPAPAPAPAPGAPSPAPNPGGTAPTPSPTPPASPTPGEKKNPTFGRLG